MFESIFNRKWSPVQMSLVSVCCVIELSNSTSLEYYIQVMYEALISDWISATRRLHANSWTYKSNKTAQPLRKHTHICRMRSEKNFPFPPHHKNARLHCSQHCTQSLNLTTVAVLHAFYTASIWLLVGLKI